MEDKSKRQYHRVDDLLPFVYRRVTDEDPQLLKKKYVSGTLHVIGVPTLPPPLEEMLWELEEDSPMRDCMMGIIKYLYSLDLKLEYIINRLEGKGEENLLLRKPEKINISGSGAKFAAREKFEEGDLIEIHLLLPGWPVMVVPALGEVVHVLPTDDPLKWETAVRFSAISEHSRDQLTRYIIRMERGLLRAAAEQKDLRGGG